MKISKIDINFFNLLRYLSPITIFIAAIVTAILMMFLYKNVYTTLSSVGEIAELRQRVAEEELQTHKFNEVQTLIKTKEQKTSFDSTKIKNIFQPQQ